MKINVANNLSHQNMKIKFQKILSKIELSVTANSIFESLKH